MGKKKKDWVPKQGKWDRKSLSKAVQCVKTRKITKFKASKIVGIPRTTLSRRLSTVTSTTSEGEIASAENMASSIGQPTQVLKSSLSVSEEITEALQLPTVVKEPAQRKTKKVLGARCVTENEFINEIRQKEEKREKDQKEKEIRKKEREEKKQKKEMEKLKKQLIKTTSKSKKTTSKSKENIPSHTDTINCCSYCGGYYYDEDSDDEDWVKCTSCDDWYHESCTGKYGCQLEHFVCDKHR